MRGERLTRLRWRLRGAWQWPAFGVFLIVDAVLLHELPVAGEVPPGRFGAFLLAGFLNLFVLGAIAPLGGMLLRRRRRDLPRAIAKDYAGAVSVVALAIGLLAAGLVHRPYLVEERRDRVASIGALHEFVAAQEPRLRDRLAFSDTVRLEEDLYRACVPEADDERAFCLLVDTAQRPPGVTRDPDRTPNTGLRIGGFD